MSAVRPGTGKASGKTLTGDEDFDGLDRVEPTLPGSTYYDPAWYEHELDRIFYREWLYLCHGSTMAKPRSFRTFKIGSQRILLVRGEDGQLRGFHNTCRHRGSILCKEAQGRLTGKAIRCPYHQWAYSMEGDLLATSSLAEAADFDKADFPLYPVHVQEWRGLVFVCLGDDAPDLRDSFERGSDRIEHWPVEDLVVGYTWRKVMKCNWKTFWDNFNECLHCPNIHPELCDLVPIYGRRISGQRDDPHWQDTAESGDPRFVGGLKEGAQSWTSDGVALREPFPNLTPEEIARGQSYFISAPSVFIACHVDYMRSVRLLPLGPEETEIEVEWLFLPETMERPDFDLSKVTDFAILVMQQDAEASELNQEGMRSRRFTEGVLMPEEHWLKRFQDWVRERTDQ
ncbi:aromatic ring-hydroxylating dioxygenase subunit alpha [Rhodospirillaceae bacterium KN72]|uniref:Aromatic ring-hydroxylating dioxygenase subunit alpha n=1 Tax=Pacificispira spongiicola TaxID=2729598 RepID=A0A7Y0DZ35_9PROT|nr:aromatic ring-hydroxylating dioxygenase subunit alpha [Pacificispira spongiicola]NMM44232.1 aromatic ring-hydroxylating dioxygenase subunit alpha [Pacificispira spongiicola]